MRKALYLLVAMILTVSFSLTAGTPSKKHAIDDDGTAVQAVVHGTIEASITVNEVDTFVENLRSILGAGRNVVRYGGNVEIALLEGTTGSYELYWGGSDNNGTNWDNFFSGHLGGTAADDDRYCGIDVNASGTYIAYQENAAGVSAGYVLSNADPFANPDGFTVNGSLTPALEDNWISFVGANVSGPGAAYGWVDFNFGNVNVGVSTDGTTFPQVNMIYNGATGFGPGVAMSGNYIAAAFTSSDSGLTPTDTAITNHAGGNGGEWWVFTESTDAGATWSAVAPVYGFDIGDFPTTTGNLDGTMGPVAAAGGTNWNNAEQPIIYNGNVLVSTANTAVTINDGTFAYGEWDGLTISGVSWKQASAGGTWTHAAVSDVEEIAAATRGDTWYVEVSGLPGDDVFGITYTDQGPAPNEIHVQLTTDGGSTWSDKFWTADVDLGIADPAAGIFISSSPWLHDAGGFAAVDITFLGDNGTIINTTQYHAVLVTDVAVGIQSDVSVIPDAVTLNQNYPNPFNPTTNISFELNQASDVTLKVYNAIGQEVATLVNGQLAGGIHTVNFQGEGLSSGVYFYTLKAGNFTKTNKMLLVK